MPVVRAGLLEFLVSHGVLPEPAADGRTPLMVYTLVNNHALVSYLLQHRSVQPAAAQVSTTCSTGQYNLQHRSVQPAAQVSTTGLQHRSVQQVCSTGQYNLQQHRSVQPAAQVSTTCCSTGQYNLQQHRSV